MKMQDWCVKCGGNRNICGCDQDILNSQTVIPAYEQELSYPYCVECGEADDLSFLGNYASSAEYKCRTCNTKFMW